MTAAEAFERNNKCNILHAFMSKFDWKATYIEEWNWKFAGKKDCIVILLCSSTRL